MSQNSPASKARQTHPNRSKGKKTLAPIRSPSWDPPKTPLTDRKIDAYILAGRYGPELQAQLLSKKKPKSSRKPRPSKTIDLSSLL